MSTPGAASSQSPLVPPGFGGVPLPPAIPAPVQRAFLIVTILIGLNVLYTLVGAFTGTSNAGGIVLTILLGAVGVYIALHFRGGRNWARITLTVLTALALLFNLLGLVGSFVLLAFAPGAALFALIVCLVGLAAGVLVLINAWKAESSAYFARFS